MEEVGRLLLCCLLKHQDLGNLAVGFRQMFDEELRANFATFSFFLLSAFS